MNHHHVDISFNDFVTIVGSIVPNPKENGVFDEHLEYYPDRILLTWISYPSYNAGCVGYYNASVIEYDSARCHRWKIDQGRGAHGHGSTIEEAIENENVNHKGSITYDQFQAIVRKLWNNADESLFKNHSPSFVDCQYYPGRIWYEWQHYTGFGAVSYDTLDEKPWFIDQGRGAHGHGSTIKQAIENERFNYYPE